MELDRVQQNLYYDTGNAVHLLNILPIFIIYMSATPSLRVHYQTNVMSFGDHYLFIVALETLKASK